MNLFKNKQQKTRKANQKPKNQKVRSMSKQLIKIILPLTSHSSKIRVKRRKDVLYQGIPVATRQEPIDSNCYFE